ncbi:MAG: DinB family protein [Chloroflexi bacterium]|nr:DinB family protein [Chloroflexota bacterium]OJV89538.1 MAG: hypothetical protein BGO39_36870 [Chloroflexi bacterium 54-19]
MGVVPDNWSERHKELNTQIRNADAFSDAVKLTLELHAELHNSKISGIRGENPVDLLFEDLEPAEFALNPSPKDATIAWATWHIARIEDLTMNILVAGGVQVFNEAWKERMQVSITDTGNALSLDEIIEFSQRICTRELLYYREDVALRSREILQHMKPADMKRKVTAGNIARIRAEGGVTGQAGSSWLLDFWGRKDMAGIILMPLTRHQALHLNACYKWKQQIRKKYATLLKTPG